MIISVIAPNALYVASQHALHGSWLRHLRWLPALTCIGVGVALSNTRAILEGLSGRQSEFVRTPKRGDRARKSYRVALPVLPWMELVLGLYCLAGVGVYVATDRLVIGPFLLIYAAGFLVTGAIGLWEVRRESAPAMAMPPGLPQPALRTE
jgi:hypothetical protein